MAFVAVPHACAIELRFTWAAVQVELTLGFSLLSDYTSTDLLDICDKVSTWWYTYARTYQRNQVMMREVYGRALHSQSGPAYTSTLHAGVTGTKVTSSPLPNNVAYVISLRTAGRGRANRGRNYWFGMSYDSLNGLNTIDATYRNGVIGVYQALLPGGAADPTPHRWCVISRQLNGVPQGRAVPITAVTTTTDFTASMRTRLPDP